ncbi:MAG: biotin--[acetyl-CoA-carboxylase] ligase [Bacteriovoracia bacterium]
MIKPEIFFLKSCESTNDIAFEKIQNALNDIVLVVTDEQTKGRGRQGRSWMGQPGNLMASLGISFRNISPLTADQLSFVPLLAGVAAIDTCQKFLPLEQRSLVHLKWPNDLMKNKEKVGGILCESKFRGNNLSCLVVGFGINLVSKPNLVDSVAQPVNCLFDTIDDGVEVFSLRNSVAKSLLEQFLVVFEKLRNNDLLSIRDSWIVHARLSEHRKLFSHVESKSKQEVEILGLTEKGLLHVRTLDGRELFLDQPY